MRAVDEIARHASSAADFLQTVGVGAVGGADDEQQVDALQQVGDGVLAVLRRVADVARVLANDRGEPLLERGDRRLGVGQAQGGLRDEGDACGIFDMRGAAAKTSATRWPSRSCAERPMMALQLALAWRMT